MKICGRTWYAVHGEVFPDRYYSYESKMVCFPALGYCVAREESTAPSGYEDRAKTEEPVRGSEGERGFLTIVLYTSEIALNV